MDAEQVSFDVRVRDCCWVCGCCWRDLEDPQQIHAAMTAVEPVVSWLTATQW